MALEADRVAQVLARAASRLRGREERLVWSPLPQGELALWLASEPWGPPALLVSPSGSVRAWRLPLIPWGVEEAERAERAGYLALEALLRDVELGRWDGTRVRWRGAPKPPPGLPPARFDDLLKAGIVPLPIPLGDRCAVLAQFPFLPGSPRLELKWAFLEERRKVGGTTLVALRVYLPLSPKKRVRVIWPVRIRGWYGRLRRPREGT
ncbi:hypothetical protein [Thermus sp.]|uniref:hypothetical protein n=1 Tax=Thermus sp. TaxID=275 RepID=UPI003D129333